MTTISTWTCSICGKVNNAKNGMVPRECITCGRQKGNNAESTWTCLICGKVHHEMNGATQKDCTTCGRKKGYAYAGCKDTAQYMMPVASKNDGEIADTRNVNRFVANQSMFVSNKYDYEADARMGIIDVIGEVKSVLASVNQNLQNTKHKLDK